MLNFFFIFSWICACSTKYTLKTPGNSFLQARENLDFSDLGEQEADPDLGSPKVINLQDSHNTQIIKTNTGEYYLRKTNPITKETFLVNLDEIESPNDIKKRFKENGELIQKQDFSRSTYPMLEWTVIESTSVKPKGRNGHKMANADNYLIVFGGTHKEMEYFNEMNYFDLRTRQWSVVSTRGNSPRVREGHSATLVGSRLYVFGGYTGSEYLNDVFVFDLETKFWTELSFKGIAPSPRNNHAACLGPNGKIIIFGGYNQEEGYFNDVYFMDYLYLRWEKPVIAGIKPSARESFSMTLVRKQVWIIGGFGLGGVFNDLHVLDLTTLTWMSTLSQGFLPPGIQGHSVVRQGRDLYLIGGCDYKKNICYNDTYILNTETLVWSLVKEAIKKFKSREGHASVVRGSMIYTFGGCFMQDECFNDIFAFNTTEDCPFSCSNNGICRGARCLCNNGFTENDCILPLKCKDDCSNRGICLNDGRCSCYPGWAGEVCDLMIPCPLNCTGNENGVCQSDSKCKCFSIYTGEACENYIGGEKKDICPNNCSQNGMCNKFTGFCICDNYHTGEDCSKIKEVPLREFTEPPKMPSKEDIIGDLKSLDKLSTSTDQVFQKGTEPVASNVNNPSLDNTPSETATPIISVPAGSSSSVPFTNPSTENTPVSVPSITTPETKPSISPQEEQPSKPQQGANETPLGDVENTPSNNTIPEIPSSGQKNESNGNPLPVPINSPETLPNETVSEPNVVNITNNSINVEQNKTSPKEEGIKIISMENNTENTAEQIVTSQDNMTNKSATDVSSPLEEERNIIISQNRINISTNQTTVLTKVNKSSHNHTIVPEMFGLANFDEYQYQEKIKEKSNYSSTKNCINRCSSRGLCINSTCYCQQGSTLEDCSVSKVSDLEKGIKTKNLIMYSGISVGAGFIIGLIVLLVIERHKRNQESDEIKEFEEDYS